MIDIYFVRHGETEGNAAKRNQAFSTRLTAKGRQQAQTAAETLMKLKPTHLFTSTVVRAVETARIISEAVSLVPETSELFIELKRPIETDGYHYFSLMTAKFGWRWYFNDAAYAGEAGESYLELRKRLTLARELLANLPDGSRVVVVTHSIYLTAFLGHCKHPSRLSLWHVPALLYRRLKIKNGSITHMEYVPELVNKECPWRLKRR